MLVHMRGKNDAFWRIKKKGKCVYAISFLFYWLILRDKNEKKEKEMRKKGKCVYAISFLFYWLFLRDKNEKKGKGNANENKKDVKMLWSNMPIINYYMLVRS